MIKFLINLLVCPLLLLFSLTSHAQTASDFSQATDAINRDLSVISWWISKEASRIITVSSTIASNYSLFPERETGGLFSGFSAGIGIIPLDAEGFRNLETEVIDTKDIDIPERVVVPGFNLIFGAALSDKFHANVRGFVLPQIETRTKEGAQIRFRNNQVGLSVKYLLFQKDRLPLVYLGLGADYINGSCATSQTDTSESSANYPGGLFTQRDVITSSSDVTWNLYSSSVYLSLGKVIGNVIPSIGTSFHLFGGNTNTKLKAEDQISLTSNNNPLFPKTEVVTAEGEGNAKPVPAEFKFQTGLEGVIKSFSIGLYGEYGVVSNMLAATTVVRIRF